jgi:hypothetical protein
MVRQEWSLIGLVIGAVVGISVLAPLLLSVGFSFFTAGSINFSNLAVSVGISAAISLGISAVVYRINLGIATDFLKKSQT